MARKSAETGPILWYPLDVSMLAMGSARSPQQISLKLTESLRFSPSLW